jgi:pilus assembly protein CpaF
MPIKIFDDTPKEKPATGSGNSEHALPPEKQVEPLLPASESQPIFGEENPAPCRPSFFEESHTDTGNLEAGALEAVSNEVIDRINRDYPPSTLQRPTETDRKEVTEKIGVLVTQAMRKHHLTPGAEAENDLAADLARRLMGLGFLDLLLPPARNDLSEITVYSSGLVQIMKKGQVRWENVNMSPSPEEIERVIDRLLGPQNKSLNETNPSINAKIPRTKDNPGGGRVKALHKAIVPPGRNSSLNIRLFEQKPVQPEWLLERKVMTSEMMAFLKKAMESGLRILITGETRTGKTTLLSALCNYLPKGWRILKIEDPEEIWIDRPTVQTVEARPQAIGTEVKPYTLADGVDDAMRMSPDYLIIGEVRDGRAAQALFRAMMTGHSGACTFHASNPREAASRLATIMGADAGVRKADANQMVADALDLLVQLGIRGEQRRVTAIAKIRHELKSGEVWFDPLYQYNEHSTADNPLWDKEAEFGQEG